MSSGLDIKVRKDGVLIYIVGIDSLPLIKAVCHVLPGNLMNNSVVQSLFRYQDMNSFITFIFSKMPKKWAKSLRISHKYY